MTNSVKTLKMSLCALTLGVTVLVGTQAFADRGGPNGGMHGGRPRVQAHGQQRRRPNQPNLVNNRREHRIDQRGDNNGLVDRGDFGRGQQAGNGRVGDNRKPNLVNNHREHMIDTHGDNNGVVDKGDFKPANTAATDTNNDGKVNRLDNKAYVNAKSKNHAPWMLKADTNNDGRVDKDELGSWKQSHPAGDTTEFANQANTPLEQKIAAKKAALKANNQAAAASDATDDTAETTDETTTE